MVHCMMEGGEEDTGNGVFYGMDCREKGKVKNLLQNGKKVLTSEGDLCIILFVGTEWIRLQSVI